jgi:hypothetical protein
MNDAPVTPTRSASSPLAAGVSAAESASIGDHLRAIVPVRNTRTRSPTVAHKIRPLSAFLMVSVAPSGLAGLAGQPVAGVRAVVGAFGCTGPHAAVRLAAAASAVPRSIAALRMLTSYSRRMIAFQVHQALLPHVISTHWLRLRFQASIQGQPDHQARRDLLEPHQDHGIVAEM